MVVGRDVNMPFVVQAQTENVWEPKQLTVDKEAYVVIASEKVS